MAVWSILVAVQPPTVVAVGTILRPPIAVALVTDQPDHGNNVDLGKVFAYATLMDDDGNAVEDALVGRLAESAHAHPKDGILAYFLFENLSIIDVGRFSIRITLIRVDSPSGGSGPSSEGMTSITQVDSRSVVVREGYVHAQSPSKIIHLLTLFDFY